MRNGTKKLIGTIVFCGAFAGVCALLNLRGKEDYSEKYAGYDLTSDVTGLEREGTYTGYLHEHEGATYPGKTVDIDISILPLKAAMLRSLPITTTSHRCFSPITSPWLLLM